MSGKKFALSLFSLVSTIALAAPTVNQHMVVAPQCLTAKINNDYKILAADKSFALFSTTDAGIDQLIAAKSAAKNCGGFMDVTRAWEAFSAEPVSNHQAGLFLSRYTISNSMIAKQTVYKIKYKKQVHTLLGQLNAQNMWNDLTTLTQFPDRYAASDEGVKAATWIKQQVENMAKQNGRNDIQVYFVETGSYKQPSVVAKVGNSLEPGVVIGAHMDTLSSRYSNKPGADDDGSGSVTVLEAARTLVGSGMKFKRPVYFIWYAAEEEGLLGSQDVVARFLHDKTPVAAVLHFDLTGYAYQNESTMWLIDDYVNKDLSGFLGSLIKTYVKKPVKHTRCGYACSDHATWTQNGFAAAIPAEAAYENTNPDIHTSSDMMSNLSLEHMTDYAKLATAFAVELGEPLK